MKILKIIRSRLGVSQEEMARRLGIIRSRVAKAELGLCKLSTDHLLQIVEIEKQLNEIKELQPLHDNASFETVEFCKNRISYNSESIYRLEKKLEAMRRNFIIAAPIFIPVEKGSAHEKRVNRRYKTCNDSAQNVAKIKIDLLKRENIALEDHIRNFSAPCEKSVELK